jgi:hypothetical protein
VTNWTPFFVWLPRKIDGEWCWLSWQERRYDDSDYIGGFYGGQYTPRVEYRIDTGDESGAYHRNGGDLG